MKFPIDQKHALSYNSDLGYIQWGLEWRVNNRATSAIIMLMLRCLIDDEFSDKVDSVTIVPSLTLFSVDANENQEGTETCKTVTSLPFQSVVKMRRVSSCEYVHVLASGSTEIPCHDDLLLSNFDTAIGCDVVIIFIGSNIEAASHSAMAISVPQPLPDDI